LTLDPIPATITNMPNTRLGKWICARGLWPRKIRC